MQPTDSSRSKSFVPPAFSPKQQTLDKRRIAVLPLQNISPDPKDEYFADGLTEELISTMSKIGGLKVIARTSVMGYKGGQKKIEEIARELKVGTILEGSVRKAGEKLRITAQLIDAESSDHLWAESYDREMRDVFVIQSDIAQRIAQTLEAQLLAHDRAEIARGSTRNTDAHAAYLKGLYYMNRGTKEGQMKGIEYFERAIDGDPAFAAAYAALADCYTYMAGSHIPAKEAFPKAKRFAQKAIELNDSLAEGHTSLGNVYLQYDWDWTKAGQELVRAIELNPSYSIAHLWYGIYLVLMRRSDEAIQELRKAEELDPLSPLVLLNVGVVFYFSRKYDEAIGKLTEASELERGDEMVYLLTGLSYLAESRYDSAILEFNKGLAIGTSADILGALGNVYAVSGRKREALDVMARLNSLGAEALNPHTNSAMIHVGLGENQLALDLLEKAVRDREEWFVLTRQSPIYDPLRSSPRFVKLMHEIGLPE